MITKHDTATNVNNGFNRVPTLNFKN